MFHSFYILVQRIIKLCFKYVFNLKTGEFIIISAALFLSLWYYVECNTIKLVHDAFAIDKIGGNTTERLYLNINRNYSASYKRDIINYIPEVDSQFDGSYNAIQLIAKAEPGKLKNVNTPGDHVFNKSIDDYLDMAQEYFPGRTLDLDSIDALYQIHSMYEVFDKAKSGKTNISGGVREETETHPFWLCFPSYDTDMYNENNVDIIKTGYIISFQKWFNGIYYAGASAHKFNYFAPYDISQMYQTFRLQATDVDSICLSFNYWGNTEFSKMDPSPDFIGMNLITFSDPEKIAKIKADGVTFHVRFSDTTNIQNTRMFILATIITILLSLWIAVAGNWILVLTRKLRANTKNRQ